MNKVRKFFLGMASVLFVVSCADDNKIIGSGNLVTETRSVGEFTRFSSDGVFEVDISENETQSVEVTADQNVMQYVKTTVSSEQLSLYLKDGNYSDINVSADIKVVDLKGISNSGTGNINAHNISGEDEFSVLNSGSATITIDGQSAALTIMNEGTGNFRGFNFTVNTCQVENIGSGDIEVNCVESLDVKIDGSGNVYYKGSPTTFNVEITGSGKVINAN